MAKRGRKTKVEEQRGRARAAAPDGRWECPGHLADEAREAFGLMVGLLSERGNLEKCDPELVAAYAENILTRKLAYAEIVRLGPVVEVTQLDREGREVSTTVKANPACAIHNAATMRIKAICYDLGLVPATSKLSETGEPAVAGGKWGDLLGVVG